MPPSDGSTNPSLQPGLLSQLRLAAGMTQEELAERSGISARGLRKLERGLIGRPHRGTLEALAAGLTLGPEDRQRLIDHYRGAPTAPTVPARLHQRVVPRQLPPAPPHFVGRAAEVGQLDRLPAASGGPSTAVIAGTAGVGKTALAVWWAHQMTDRFPDGQLFVNLRGFDPSAEPVAPTDVLRGFLVALGQRPENITASFEERVGLYRSVTADRRVLVVLDNARDVEQVRPLLPASPDAVAIVTSRNRLAGLVAEQGARPVPLDLLSSDAAVELLGSRLGRGPAYQHEQLSALSEGCARLPLALVVAAARLAITPEHSIESVVEDLTHRQSKLDTLHTGDPHTSARNVFSWSYRELSPVSASTFRLLGLHPGTDFDVFAAAALANSTTGQAQDALHTLARAHLIHEHAPGRYTMHDLLWTWAAECAASDETARDRTAALARLRAAYQHTAGTAVMMCTPRARGQVPEIAAPATPSPRIDDSSQASAWLHSERHNLIAVAIHAADNGNPGYTVELAAMLFNHLRVSGGDAEALRLHDAAAQSATGPDRASTMLRLGASHEMLGQGSDAVTILQEALRLSRESDDKDTQVRALQALALLQKRVGRYDDSLTYHQRALKVAESMSDRVREGVVRNDLGAHLLLLGRNEEALAHLHAALDIAEDGVDPQGACAARTNLAELHQRLGDDAMAADQLSQALSIARAVDYREAIVHILSALAIIEARTGQQDRALQHHRGALEAAREASRPTLEVLALTSYGNTLRRIGRPDDALMHHSEALDLLGPAVGHLQFGQLHEGLGDDYDELGDGRRASEHWRQAMTVYRQLGVPEADDLQSRLSLRDPDSARE